MKSTSLPACLGDILTQFNLPSQENNCIIMTTETRTKLVHTNHVKRTHHRHSPQRYFTTQDTLKQLQLSCAAESSLDQEVFRRSHLIKSNWILLEPKDYAYVTKVNKWGCLLPRSWLHVFLLVTLCILQATSQDCEFPSDVINVSEADPEGTLLFNISSHNRTISYNYTTNLSWLPAFLNLTFNETDLFYYMRLTKPLDLEYIRYNLNVADTSSFSIKVVCQKLSEKRQDVVIIVQAVNEYDPEFNTSSIELTVNESLEVRSVLINLSNWASDRDVNQHSNEIAGFEFLPYSGDPEVDGHKWLEMTVIPYGVVVLKNPLDYESLPAAKKFITIGVLVKDQGGKSGSSSLTIFVEDVDDLSPYFTYPGCVFPCYVEYSFTVSSSFTGPVTNIKPAPIYAQDGDALNYTIEYHIIQGIADQYIDMNKDTAAVTIKQELGTSGQSYFVLMVQAREKSILKKSNTTTLLIVVRNGTKEEEIINNRSGSNDNDTIIAVAAVLSAIVLITLILLVLMLMYYKKRYRKTIHPVKSATTLQGDQDVPDGSNDQKQNNTTTPRFNGMKLNQNKNFELILSTDKQDDEKDSPQLMPNQNSSQKLNAKDRKENAALNNKVFQNSEDDDNEDSENLESNLKNTEDVSKKLPQNKDKDLIQTSADRDVGELKSPSGPTITKLYGLKKADDSKEVGRQITMEKDDNVSTSRSDFSDTTLSSRGSESANTETELTPTKVPLKKKRSRKRTKSVKSPEEDIYDGTNNVENLELDSGFYTDSTKTMIRRSTRTPAVILDPNDTRYWITVDDQF